MNPVITPVGDDLITYQLTKEDRKRLREIEIKPDSGSAEDIVFHKMCIMQAVAALTTQADVPVPTPDEYHGMTQSKTGRRNLLRMTYTDHPICVSEEITSVMIKINDTMFENLGPRQQIVFKNLVEEILNTCPVRRTTTQLKTKVRVNEFRAATSPEYKAAEQARKRLLEPLDQYLDFLTDGSWFDGRPRKVSFTQCVRLIREAAALYKVQPTSA